MSALSKIICHLTTHRRKEPLFVFLNRSYFPCSNCQFGMFFGGKMCAFNGEQLEEKKGKNNVKIIWCQQIKIRWKIGKAPLFSSKTAWGKRLKQKEHISGAFWTINNLIWNGYLKGNQKMREWICLQLKKEKKLKDI